MAAVKLATGKRPHVESEHDFRLGRYLKAAALPAVPQEFGHYRSVTRWGMLGNDNAGDCVWAGAAHEHRLWNAAAGRRVSFSVDGVLGDYSAATGFVRGRPDTDNGSDVREAMAYRQKVGVADSRHHRRKIAAYTKLDGTWDQLLLATYIFGAVGIGVVFPDSAMDQFNLHEPWDVDSFTDAAEGHYVCVVGAHRWRGEQMLVVVSWGRTQFVTRRFYEHQADESWGVIAPDYLNAIGKTPEGLDVTALNADLKSLGKRGIAVPSSVPTPNPEVVDALDRIGELLLRFVPAKLRGSAKAVLPAIAGAVATLAQLIGSGHFGKPELATLLSTWGGSALTWLVKNRFSRFGRSR